MKLLVPLDGSRLSEAILDTVAAAARRLRAEVVLLAVGAPARVHATPRAPAQALVFPMVTPSGGHLAVPAPADLMPPPAEDRGQATERAEAELRDYLARCAERLSGIPVHIRAVLADDPAAAIIAAARAEGATWIAMTTHGRSGLSQMLAGSVADAVIRSGVAPVLVLRPTLPDAP